MTIPLKHIPIIKVKLYPIGSYAYRGGVYSHMGHSSDDREGAIAEANRVVAEQRDWRDAIIFEIEKDSRCIAKYRIYLARQDEKLSLDEAEWIGYGTTPSDRETHIKSMYDAGRRGIKDMSTLSKRLVRPPPDKSLCHSDISPDYDILGFDHPRKDILVEKTNAGKAIRTGGGGRELLSLAATDVLNKNFTRDEVRKMNLYFEAGKPMVEGVAGTHAIHRGMGMPVSTISVPLSGLNEAILTHEIVHALRAADGRRAVKDRDSEEIETAYETTLRLQEPRKVRGYYQYVPGALPEGASWYDTPFMEDCVLADRILATGATDKPLKGRRLTHNIVPNTVERSRIETARPLLDLNTPLYDPRTDEDHSLRQMPAEDVDTYFQIKLPDKSTVEYHIRFDEARPSLAKIKKHLKDRFGKNIEAWEWKDGKRVRLISRRKKRTTTKKRTTKKATTRKTPSKRRIPMTNRPNQHLKGIPPIPGGFL